MNPENTPTLPLPDAIRTVDDFIAFQRAIWSEGVNFHPEDDFFDYVEGEDPDENGEYRPCYTHEEATLRNTLLEQAYAVCEAAGVDICEIGLDEYLYLVCGVWQSEEDQDEEEYSVETELASLPPNG